MKILSHDQLMARAAKVQLLILDVDGVLTDGSIILDDEGRQLKAFNVRDGHGIKMLQREGVKVAIITGRNSRVVEHRAQELGIEHVYQGAKKKLPVFEALCASLGVEPAHVAYVGDDIVDLPVMVRVGLSVAVANASAETREYAHHITKASGGRGAVRELVELILKARGRWNDIIAAYAQI